MLKHYNALYANLVSHWFTYCTLTLIYRISYETIRIVYIHIRIKQTNNISSLLIPPRRKGFHITQLVLLVSSTEA